MRPGGAADNVVGKVAPKITCRFFSFGAMVALSGQRIKNRSTLATMYGCSRRTVVRVQCGVAL
eukprot:10275821-Karenia_brevis.AAC.1